MAANSAEIPALLHVSAVAMGLALGAEQAEALTRFVETLLIWRRRMPLVSQRTATEIIAKHVEDSFSLVPLVRPGARLADLGSGAGFPGMVVAIACPENEVVLIESKRRKASFLRAAVRACRAENVAIVEARVEDLAPSFRSAFDLVVSRAVWPGDEFFSKARPLLRSGGTAVAMKTPREEPPEGPPPRYVCPTVRLYRLSGGEDRALAIAEAD